MSGVEILQPGGAGSFNAEGVASPEIAHIASDMRVYFRLVSSTSSYASSTVTKASGGTVPVVAKNIRGLGFLYGFSPTVENESYTIAITDNLGAVRSITLFCECNKVPGTFSADSAPINVSWFGGMPTAKYFSSTTGKWYQDAGLTVEATDDAPTFQAAVDYAHSLGGGNVYFPSGNWYFRNAPTGTHGEYVTVHDGITIFGDGDASCVRVSPNRMTGASNTGYSCVFGLNDNVAVDNVRFRDFRIDHNSQHNQMSAVGGVGLTYGFGASVCIPKGSNVRLNNLTSINHAARFNFLVGFYGYQAQTFNVIIDGCQCLHEGDDPKVGDTSCIVASAINSQVTNCTVDTDIANNIAWPSGNNIITAYEIHSTNGIFSNNVARYTARLLNLAGDSLDQDQFIVSHNVGDGVISGITLYEFSSHVIDGLDVGHNQLKIRQGVAGFGEAGIAVADPAAQLLPDGNGFLHARFHHNKIEFAYGTPTASFSFGMNMLGRALHVRIHDNDLSGFTTIGILWLATSRAANAGNLLQNLSIEGNKLYRCGAYGIFVGGKAGEAADVATSLHIKNNEIIDDRGGGSQMGYGVYVNVRADSDLSIWKNHIVGALTADTFLDTATYPAMANKADTFPTNVNVTGTMTASVAVRAGGTSTPQQTLHVTGGALISLEYLQNADNSGAAISWATDLQILRDTQYLKSRNGATTYLTVAAGGITPGINFLDMPYVTWTKKTDPSAPAANKGVMYLRDNGAGKMQLVAKFPTGAVQVIATEP